MGVGIVRLGFGNMILFSRTLSVAKSEECGVRRAKRRSRSTEGTEVRNEQ